MRSVHRVVEVRAAERALMARLPDHALMERASFALAVECASELKRSLGRVSGARAVGLIGLGDNGSDALWALALLAKRGVSVAACSVLGERTPTHADELFAAAGGHWIELAELLESDTKFNLVLDGIAGLGSAKPLLQGLVHWVRRTRSADSLVISVDIPSGVAADTGLTSDVDSAIEADLTVTFGCLKPALVFDPGLEFCGEVRLIDIGLDVELPRATLHSVGDSLAISLLPEIAHSDHKYTRGVVNIVAGSKQFPGAGVLAAKAARWGGAGMVVHSGEGAQFSADSPAVVVDVDIQLRANADAYVVGPGGADEKLVEFALAVPAPLILDAGALQALIDSDQLQEALRERTSPTVLTPHAGEFKRLLAGYGITVADTDWETAQELAAKSGAVVYLKGSVGVVATPEGEIFATRRTSEHLATAGSGDVLAGFLGSWLAALKPTSERAMALVTAAAVLVHSLAAEIVAEDGEPVSAEAIEENLPAAIADIITD